MLDKRIEKIRVEISSELEEIGREDRSGEKGEG